MNQYCVMIGSIFEGITLLKSYSFMASCEQDALNKGIAETVGIIVEAEVFMINSHEELLEEYESAMNDLPF